MVGGQCPCHYNIQGYKSHNMVKSEAFESNIILILEYLQLLDITITQLRGKDLLNLLRLEMYHIITVPDSDLVINYFLVIFKTFS